MSKKTVSMPALGMSQDEGIIVEWHKKIGDLVKKEETVMSVETDKTVMDIPSPCDGMIADIFAPTQVPIAVGKVVADIETDKSLFSKIDVSKKIPTDLQDVPDEQVTDSLSLSHTGTNTAELDGHRNEEEQLGAPLLQEHHELSTRTSVPTSNVVRASPKAKYVAEQHGIDIKMLRGFQKLAEPYDSEDVNEYVAWKTQGKENYVVLEARVSLDAFNAVTNTMNETRTDELPLQLWLQTQSYVINQCEKIKEIVYTNNGAINVTKVNKGIWEEFVVRDILSTKKHFILEAHTQGTSSFFLSYISHPNISTYRVFDCVDIHVLLAHNEKTEGGTIHMSCKEGLLQEAELLEYMESLIQVIELPLRILM